MDETIIGFTIPGVEHQPYVIRPWVGSKYESQKLRIVAHGDSYWASEGDQEPYSWGAWCRGAKEGTLGDTTCGQIGSVVAGGHTGTADESGPSQLHTQMYAGVVKAISGRKEIGASDVRTVFEKIAFNNYVHVPMRKSDEEPTPEQMLMAHKVYIRELSSAELCRPHLSLVFVKRVWNSLEGGREVDGVTVNGVTRQMWLYELPAGPVLVGWLKHPASYWRNNGWRDDVEIPIAQAYIQAAAVYHGVA
ncbi:MAG TPA: hypothetical protein VG456_15935 [Candidatus Sulfopaludibacter sp.]|jgi:hypothetical protein|nr:hypothetical protein [Candidatus Sulfopaludibacter sp.]